MDLSKGIELESSKSDIPINEHFKLYAGPGAGKTTFIVNHIRNILVKSTKLNNTRRVACITYTNIGVNTLKKRLKDSVSDVEISTIHSFLYRHIVKPYLWTLKDCPFPVEKINGHDDIILSKGQLFEYKKRSKQTYLKDDKKLSEALSKLIWTMNDGKLKLDYPKFYYGSVGKYSISKDSYKIYKQICWENGLLAHDDVLYFSYLLLKQEEKLKEVIRAKFPYILIDEFQDTSPLQVEIIKMIAEKETIVGVIGDPCQAIFSFQGTDAKLFDTFKLNGMKSYYIRSNHRSTEQIISILDHIRNNKDFKQKSPKKKQGEQPKVLVGLPRDAYQYIKNSLDDDFFTLAYRNDTVKSIEVELVNELKPAELDFVYKDSNRGWVIYFIICAIEYGKQLKINDALKSMKKAYRKQEDFTDKDAFINLKRLLDQYDKFYQVNITNFYNNYLYGYHGVKQKISRGKIKEEYDQLTYESVSIAINIEENNSKFKTIHQAKGDEFDNVLVICPDRREESLLDFLIKSDMDNEEHRVYYVALSRAKKNLYISVPIINDNSKKAIEALGFKVQNV